MKALLDTNIILDMMLNREPWVAEAEGIWKAVEAGQVQPHVCASSITDIFYITRKLAGAENARRIVRVCLDQLVILGVTHALLEAAYLRENSDFEDDLQIACAEDSQLDAIVTRDPKGFAESTVAVLSPMELLERLSKDEQA